MCRTVVYAIVVSLAAFGMSAPSSAQKEQTGRQNVHRAVEAFVTKYLERYNKKDAAAVASLYTEDGILVPPGPIVTGKQNIEKAWRAAFDAGRTGLRYNTQQIQAGVTRSAGVR